MEKPDIFTWQKTGHYYVGLTQYVLWLDYNHYLIYKPVFNKENIQKRTVDLF